MSTGGPDDRLTTDEVALVLRRAAELEAQSTGADLAEGLAASVVLEAAEEVGLSPVAVRQALAELHAGAIPAAGVVQPRRALLVGPASVVEARLVAATPDEVLVVTDRFLARGGFEQRRRQGYWILYRERRDLLSRMRRRVAVDRAQQLGGVSAVVVTMSPLAEVGTMVRFEATLRPGWRGVAAMAIAYGILAVTGSIAVATDNAAVLVAGAPVGAAIGVAGWERRRRWRHRRRDEIGEALAATLDHLA
jgi:hypothetical protein